MYSLAEQYYSKMEAPFAISCVTGEIIFQLANFLPDKRMLLPYHIANLHTIKKLFPREYTLAGVAGKLTRKTFSFSARSSKLDRK